MAALMQAQTSLVPSVSNFHLTWTTFNPAFSGYRDVISVSSLYRSPLYGRKLGPTDMQLNMHTPVGNSKVALGGMVAYNHNDPQGLVSVMSTYAYRIYLGSGRLAFGLSAGMYGYNSNMSAVQVRDPGDPAFSAGDYQRWFPNFGTGLLYYNDKFFAGISVPELMSIPLEGESLGKLRVQEWRVLFTGSYLFDFSEAFRLKPTILIDYSRAGTTFKGSLNAGLFNSRVFVGGAYHHPNFGIALLNFQVNPKWMIGYAYSFNLGEISRQLGGGSHELVMRWELKPTIKTIVDDPFYF